MTTPTQDVPAIDWPAAEAEVTRHLQNLLRLQTVNPPGNETLATSYIRDQLAEVGVEVRDTPDGAEWDLT